MKYFSLIPVILVFLIFDGGQCSAQLLNVESMRIRTDTTGWFGEVGLSGSYIESESTVLQADARGLIEYKGKKSLILLLGNYNLLTGDGKSLVDNYMLHLRYNYKITKWLRWEVFEKTTFPTASMTLQTMGNGWKVFLGKVTLHASLHGFGKIVRLCDFLIFVVEAIFEKFTYAYNKAS